LKRAPALILRGARSDVLSSTAAQAMAARLGKNAELVTIPECGHAPMLDEPEAAAAIDRLLAKVAP
jgi:pimeloyl-ACP methyl ester carboxylesterase